jgi:hypothetical protein
MVLREFLAAGMTQQLRLENDIIMSKIEGSYGATSKRPIEMNEPANGSGIRPHEAIDRSGRILHKDGIDHSVCKTNPIGT